ncbi:DUF4349 domain-containing protein [Thalassiella azotivora]
MTSSTPSPPATPAASPTATPPAPRPLATPLRRRPRRRLVLAATSLAVALPALVLGACSAGAGDESAQSAPAAQDPVEGGATADGGDGAGGSGGGGPGAGSDGSGASAGAAVDDQRRIRRGGVAVEVSDLGPATQTVRDVAASHGGFVAQEASGRPVAAHVAWEETAGAGWDAPGGPADDAVAPRSLSPRGPGEAVLVVRVPSDRFRTAADDVAALGTEVGRWSTETLVEDALVDLESRMATQRASVERVRALMAEATSLADVVALESELATREADLESLRARHAALAGQADLATLTVHLRTPGVAAATDDATGFLPGLRAGRDALVTSTQVLLTAVGALLPFAAVAAVVVVPVLAVRRRRRSG